MSQKDYDMRPRWYVVHTYSGYENKVKKDLEKTIKNRELEDYFFDIIVPMEEQIEIKDGKIYDASVSKIEKSRDGKAGEKNATYDTTTSSGEIDANEITGIYGTYKESIENMETITTNTKMSDNNNRYILDRYYGKNKSWAFAGSKNLDKKIPLKERVPKIAKQETALV